VRRSQLVEAWVDSEEIGSAVWQGGSTPPSLPMTEKYNGYTNYPTWRVNLEIISEIDFSECDYEITADYLEEIVQDIVIYSGNVDEVNSLAADYARAFLAEVNYYELASMINEEIEEKNQI